MAAQGLEHPANSSQKTGVGDESGAECGALGAREASIDPDLVVVADAWKAMPGAIKAAILAMVRAAT
jgi:hypothetical protein